VGKRIFGEPIVDTDLKTTVPIIHGDLKIWKMFGGIYDFTPLRPGKDLQRRESVSDLKITTSF
jgi:hypothetical protein